MDGVEGFPERLPRKRAMPLRVIVRRVVPAGPAIKPAIEFAKAHQRNRVLP